MIKQKYLEPALVIQNIFTRELVLAFFPLPHSSFCHSILFWYCQSATACLFILLPKLELWVSSFTRDVTVTVPTCLAGTEINRDKHKGIVPPEMAAAYSVILMLTRAAVN